MDRSPRGKEDEDKKDGGDDEEDRMAAKIIRNIEGNNKVRVHTPHSHSFRTILATLHIYIHMER